MGTRYTLYTARRSGSASVEALMGALELDVELRDATPWSEPPGPFFSELRQVNPLGQLPTLVTPGGEVLTESVAILWTLLERHPSEWLPPASTRDRATCLRWMQFATATIYTAVGAADYPQRWTTASDQAAHKAVEAAALQRMQTAWDIVAGAYRDTPFFLGQRPCVCDIYLANLSRWWKMREHLRARWPDFCDVMERVDALPEVAPVWARHWQ
jgi:GST-like protein